MLVAFAALAVGAAILSQSADEFVTGAARLAMILKVSPVVVGALIIGFGTSAPEMIVSGIAAVQGNTDVGVGNIIGSNIANLTLILGAAALLVPIAIGSDVLRQEAPLSAFAAVVFAGLVIGGLSTVEGVLLTLGLILAIFVIVRNGRNGELVDEVEELTGNEEHSITAESVRTLIGLGATVGGAWLFVWGALDLADQLGVSGGFIGVTLVALGTSLPELVTSVAAARKGEDELIIGNLLGSNLFNSLAVGAVVGLFGNGTIDDPSLTGSDLVFMLAVCIGMFIAMRIRGTLRQLEGAIAIAIFFAFVIFTYLGEVSTQAALP